MGQTFRVKRSSLYFLVVFLVLDSGAAISASLYLAADHEMIVMAGLIGGFILPLVIIGLLLLVHGVQHKLIIHNGYVESAGCRTTRRIRLKDVAQAKWRVFGDGGRLTLVTASAQLTIEFSRYTTGEQRILIRFFYEQLAPSIHAGWKDFWGRYWHVFDDSDPSPAAERHIKALRRRIDTWFVVGSVLLGLPYASLWYLAGCRRSLGHGFGFLLLLPVFWLFAHLAIGPHGRVHSEHVPMHQARWPVFLGALAISCGSVLILLTAWDIVFGSGLAQYVSELLIALIALISLVLCSYGCLLIFSAERRHKRDGGELGPGRH